MFDLFEC